MAELAVLWGLGRFGGGLGAALALDRSGYALRVMDRRSARDLAPALAELAALGGPCEVEVVGQSETGLEDASLLVVNPAIPPSHALLAAARERGIETTQELDLALDAYPGRAIAVTGTNGKSTTAALLASALGGEAAGVLLAGNIGRSLFLDAERWRNDQWAVVEVSSFQAERLGRRAHFAAAVFTPIGVDHLDWHTDLGRYRAAKLRVLDRCAPGAPVVGLARCEVLAQAVAGRPGVTLIDAPEIVRGPRLALVGGFHAENAALALAASRALGRDERSARAGIEAFSGLPHRLQELAPIDGIRFFDNGVSTVCETSLSALESLRPLGPLRWIAGGRPKVTGLDRYAAELAPMADSLHLFGEAGPALAASVAEHGGSRRKVTVHERLEPALDAAWARARPGDILVFSPGFTSLDQYANFVERAIVAKAWWSARAHRASGDSGARASESLSDRRSER